jgi:hypothetical protein
MENGKKILFRKLQAKWQRRKFEDNIKDDLKKTGREGVDKLEVAQSRVERRVCFITVINLQGGRLEKTE